MRKMMELYDHMADEARDGKGYAESAARLKDVDPGLASVYEQLAKDRLEALKRLKAQGRSLYDQKSRAMTERGEDIRHVTEVQEWMSGMACRQACELEAEIDALR